MKGSEKQEKKLYGVWLFYNWSDRSPHAGKGKEKHKKSSGGWLFLKL